MKDIVSSNGYPDDKQIERMLEEYAPKSKESSQSRKLSENRRVDDDRRQTSLSNLAIQAFSRRAIYRDRLDHENRIRSSLEITNARENKAFGPALDVLPQKVRDLVVNNGDVLGVPYACVHSAGNTVQGGFHGAKKARIFPVHGNFALSYSPSISTILAGPTGTGKTPCSKTFTLPLIETYNKQASQYYLSEKRRITRTTAEIEKLSQGGKLSIQERETPEEKIARLELILEYVHAGSAAYCKTWNSIQSICNYLYANRVYAEIKNCLPDGFCLWIPNAGPFYRCRSESKIEKLISQWSVFDDFMDNNLIPSVSVTRKEDDESTEDFIGGTILSEAQTMTFSCLQVPDLSDNGFYTRPHVCYTSKDRIYKDVSAENLLESAELWLDFLAFTHNFRGAPFIYSDDVDVNSYSKRIEDLEKEASEDGKIWLTAYFAKQYQRTHQQALNLKLWKLALESDKDNPPTYPGWNAFHISKLVDFTNAPDWTKIDKKMFEDATVIEDCYVKIFDMTTDHLLDATGWRRSTTVSRPVGRERLNENAQSTYNVGWERGEPCIWGPNGDVWGKKAIVKTLYSCHAYRNHCDREEIDLELKDHGLMFYDAGTRLERGERIFISQEVTSAQIRSFLGASDVADDEES